MRTEKHVLCAVAAALICVLAPLSLAVGPVPVTMATFAVMLSGALLGGRYGSLSVIIYLLLGAVGLPVCAGWTPALPRLMGPTGGYLIGYIPLAFICGAVYSARGRNHSGAARYAVLASGMVAGNIALYALGTAWFCALNSVGIGEALAVCVVPFLLGDAIKIAAVTAIAPQLERALGRFTGKKQKQ